MAIFFFFNDTATTEIYTLSLHDALPICGEARGAEQLAQAVGAPDEVETVFKVLEHLAANPDHRVRRTGSAFEARYTRSEEHTSELQSRQYLVCRLLLEKKKS